MEGNSSYFLAKINFEGDLRRCRFTGNDWKKFQEDIAKLFFSSETPPPQYTLSYKDDEGDTCSITTQSELEEAIRIMSRNGAIPRFSLNRVVVSSPSAMRGRLGLEIAKLPTEDLTFSEATSAAIPIPVPPNRNAAVLEKSWVVLSGENQAHQEKNNTAGDALVNADSPGHSPSNSMISSTSSNGSPSASLLSSSPGSGSMKKSSFFPPLHYSQLPSLSAPTTSKKPKIEKIEEKPRSEESKMNDSFFDEVQSFVTIASNDKGEEDVLREAELMDNLPIPALQQQTAADSKAYAASLKETLEKCESVRAEAARVQKLLLDPKIDGASQQKLVAEILQTMEEMEKRVEVLVKEAVVVANAVSTNTEHKIAERQRSADVHNLECDEMCKKIDQTMSNLQHQTSARCSQLSDDLANHLMNL